MSIVRIARKRPYTAIPNVILESHGLSFKARGLLCYLLSKPDTWETNTHRLAREAKKDGRDSILTAMKELQIAGFAKVVKTRSEGGLLSTNWIIYDTPYEDEREWVNPTPVTRPVNTPNRPEWENPTVVENPPESDLPESDKPDAGKPDSLVITELVNTEQEDKDSNDEASLLRRAVKQPTALRWAESDMWLYEFLTGEGKRILTQVNIPLENKWWDAVSIACRGVDEQILRVAFAEMSAWLDENPKRIPTERGTKKFIRGWLIRNYEKQRRFKNG